MFIRVNANRIINTDRIVEVFVLEAHAAEDAPLSLSLYMTGLDEEGGGRKIQLFGLEAERFLAGLPVYEPVEES